MGAVVWATGYRSDYTWIDVPGVLRDGRVVHARGVTEVPGLYFLGLSWQHTRGSALLGFVGDDAAHVAAHDRTAARRVTRLHSRDCLRARPGHAAQPRGRRGARPAHTDHVGRGLGLPAGGVAAGASSGSMTPSSMRSGWS